MSKHPLIDGCQENASTSWCIENVMLRCSFSRGHTVTAVAFL